MTEISGYVAEGFGPVRDAFAQNFVNDLELGASFALFQNDEILVDLRGGYTDRKRENKWTETTIVPVYSTTKPISALVVFYVLINLVEDANWETPVADIWPEFATHGKDKITIAEMMSHQAGLPGFVDPIDPELWLQPRQLAARLAEQEPMWLPDGVSGYHPTTWGYLVGELVERLAGKSVGTILREVITHSLERVDDPIDFWIGTPASEHERVADIQRPRDLPQLGELNDFNRTAFLTKWSSPNRGGAEWREIEIPSANGHGNAKSVAQLYAAYALHRIGNTRLTPNERDWDAFLEQRSFGKDRVLPFITEFACGVMRNNAGFYGPNPNAFGHSGWGGSAALGDPDEGVSMAYVMNRQSNALQGDSRARSLIDAAYTCL